MAPEPTKASPRGIQVAPTLFGLAFVMAVIAYLVSQFCFGYIGYVLLIGGYGSAMLGAGLEIGKMQVRKGIKK